ncbi:MAG: hypothetical protein AB7R55_09235, partial [Gemmatimonadales bacterium]
MDAYTRELTAKIKSLNEVAWEGRVDNPRLLNWLSNFTGAALDVQTEHLNALHLLAGFVYFGSREIRTLLRSLYRDHVRHHLVARIRQRHGSTLSPERLQPLLAEELKHTRFVALGNPAESGAYLMYLFRQENHLPKDMFIHASEVIKERRPRHLWSRLRLLLGGRTGRAVRHRHVRHYFFLDDLCGSGQQAISYSRSVVSLLKALAPGAEVGYLVLFANSDALDRVRRDASFDFVHATYHLEPSDKCFHPTARLFSQGMRPPEVDREAARKLASEYGKFLEPRHPLGYRDGQYALGFHHNVPDNTLPIFWCSESPSIPWHPVFQ